MKKILVTGATGFIGNYIVTELLKLGHTVVASSATREKAKKCTWFNSVNYQELDFTKMDLSLSYFDFFGKPDLVIHLSWEGLPNYKSLFHFEENLPRHYMFLKNLVVGGCSDITVTGTCFEYGMADGLLSENTVTNPCNPYGLAKDSLNKFLLELRQTEDFVLKWVRLFYLYGKGQHSRSLFSQLDMALQNGEEEFNMSGGEQIRDYLPVETAASYMVRIALQKRITGNINCCSGEPVSVKNIVNNYLKEKGENIRLNLGYYSYPDYEPMSFWGDNKKLQNILNEQ